MAEFEILTIGVVVLVDYPVPIHESLEAHGKLFNVPIDFVKAGSIVSELDFVGTDSGSSRSEGGKSDRLHI